MKISKIFFVVILAGLLLLGYCYVKNLIQYSKKKAEWEAQVGVLIAEIAQLEGEIEVHLKDADKWRDRAFEKIEELKVMKGQLIEAERRHSEALASVAELAPDELVLQSRYYLDVSSNDVILMPKGVMFSIKAVRQLVTDLADYEFLVDEKVLSLEGQVKAAEKAIELKDLETLDLRSAIEKLTIDRDKWKKLYYGEHDLRLASENAHQLFNTKYIVTSAVIVAIVGGLTLFLR